MPVGTAERCGLRLVPNLRFRRLRDRKVITLLEETK